MKKVLLLLAVLGSAQLLVGCAIVHRYPTYRGTVLELGTDKPIEKAGVLMSHWLERPSVAGWTEIFLGYRWAVTDREGGFTVPAMTYFRFTPLAMFKWDPEMTIYKKGYGGYPSVHVKTKPDGLPEKKMPGNKEVTFWLPRCDWSKEITDQTIWILDHAEVPPEGLTRNEFEDLFGH